MNSKDNIVQKRDLRVDRNGTKRVSGKLSDILSDIFKAHVWLLGKGITQIFTFFNLSMPVFYYRMVNILLNQPLSSV